MGRITEEVKQLTRERLIWAAAEAFAEHGVEGARIGDISLAAGLARGTVYNYFDNKQDLMLAIIEYFADRATANAPGLTDEPIADQLRRILEVDIAWVREHEPFAKLFLRELVNLTPDLYARVLAATMPFPQRLARVVEEGVRRGEIRTDLSPQQLALTLSGLKEMALLQHWGTGGWPTYDDIPALITDLFLNGAHRRSSPP